MGRCVIKREEGWEDVQVCILTNHMHVWKSRGIWLETQNRMTRDQSLKKFHLPKPKTEEAKKIPSHLYIYIYIYIYIHNISLQHVIYYSKSYALNNDNKYSRIYVTLSIGISGRTELSEDIQ